MCIRVQQKAQEQEQSNHHNLHHSAYDQVLLALARVFARQCTLHQVLIQTCSCDHEEDTRQELLPEIRTLFRIIKEESASHRTTSPTFDIHTRTQDKVDTQRHRQDQTAGLQQVCPNQRFNTTLEGTEIHNQYGKNSIYPEWYTQWAKHQQLQYLANYKQTHTCAQHLAHKEQPRT